MLKLSDAGVEDGRREREEKLATAEIARIGGRYAVVIIQGHDLTLVSTESLRLLIS